MSQTRSSRLRGAVAQRDGGVCVDCPPERGAWPYEKWHADHDLALVFGGADSLDNLVTRCIPHHREKTKAEGSNCRGGRPGRGMQMMSFYVGRTTKEFMDDLAAERRETKADTFRAMLSYALAEMPDGWTPAER